VDVEGQQTTIAAWRASRQSTLALSCGLSVRVQPVDLAAMAASGAIPAPLVEMIGAEEDPGSPKQAGFLGTGIAADVLPEVTKMVNAVVMAAVVAPPVAEVADDDHVGIEELPLTDRFAIFGQVSGVTAQLVPFRGEPEQPVAAALPG
jgi:hypothetical protein